MSSCSQSNEDKAEKLVKETLKGYLFSPDSYEPLSTKVDSLFIDVETVENIIKLSDEIKTLTFKINRYKDKIKSAESSMDTWFPDGYSSHYARGEYGRAKKEKEETKSYLDKYSKKLTEHLICLKENVTKCNKKIFSGWIVRHRFRSHIGIGTITIPEEMVFLCDKEFSNCLVYENYKFDKFKEILKEVNEAISDEDITDYFKENCFLL